MGYEIYEEDVVLHYFLLYKLINSEILWIIKVSRRLHKLEKHIKNFNSKIELYYIVSKFINPNSFNYDFKQFTRFHPDKYCTIIYQTLL